MTPTTAPRELVLHRRYPTSAEDVWAALTDSDRLARWYGRYTGSGGPGGTVELVMTGEVDAGGEESEPVTVTIHECERPRRLVVEVPESTYGSWWIAVDITPDTTPDGADGATLTFTQRLVEGMSEADMTAGWSWYLDRLGAALAGTPMPDWTDYAP